MKQKLLGEPKKPKKNFKIYPCDVCGKETSFLMMVRWRKQTAKELTLQLNTPRYCMKCLKEAIKPFGGLFDDYIGTEPLPGEEMPNLKEPSDTPEKTAEGEEKRKKP